MILKVKIGTVISPLEYLYVPDPLPIEHRQKLEIMNQVLERGRRSSKFNEPCEVGEIVAIKRGFQWKRAKVLSVNPLGKIKAVFIDTAELDDDVEPASIFNLGSELKKLANLTRGLKISGNYNSVSDKRK